MNSKLASLAGAILLACLATSQAATIQESAAAGDLATLNAFFAAGAYAGRHLGSGAVIVAWIAAFAVLMIMNFTARRSPGAATALLAIFGVLMGAASAPTLVWYASTEPQILWQAGGATALFVGALGSFGYLTKRDLSGVRRASFIGLLIVLLAGVALIFVRIPHA